MSILSCTKKAIAPLRYFITQIGLLACLVLTTPLFISLDHLIYIIFFWLSVIVSIALYIAVRSIDPGFVPNDAVFFTDQEQEPAGNEKEMNSRPLDSFRETQKRYAFKKQMEMMNRRTGENRGRQGSDSLQFLNIKPKFESIHTIKTEAKDKEGERQIGNAVIPISHIGVNIDAVQCEPSMEGEEIFYCDEKTHDGHKEEDQSKQEIQEPNHLKKELPETSLILKDIVIEGKNKEQNNASQHDEQKDQVNRNIEGVEEKVINKVNDVPENMAHIDADKTNSTIVQTGDKYKLDKIGGDSHISLDQEDNMSGINKGFSVRLNIRKLDEKRLFTIETHFNENCDISNDKEEADVTKEPAAEIEIPVQSSTIKQEQNITGGTETNQISQQIKTTTKEGETFYVERRYCLVCNIEQPIRSKHCKFCNKCISRYDHHCPWLGIYLNFISFISKGTCIGEKNHLLFYCFLISHVVELGWADTQLIISMITENTENWISENIWRLLLAIAITGFLLFVLSLVIFHTYLITQNLTTCKENFGYLLILKGEKLSWNKITYLSDWNKKWGSPFSWGLARNLKFFFFESKKQLRRWKMPKYKKPAASKQIV